MKLFYQPLYLNRDPKDNSSTNGNHYFIPCEDNTYYTYVNTKDSFKIAVATATDLACINTYTSNIKINHFRSKNIKPDDTTLKFIQADDSSGDVRSVIFSFQEIDSLITGNNYKKYVLLENAVEDETFKKIKYLKHHILLKASNDLNRFTNDFTDMYGNLSHLCPPSCNGVNYTIISN